MINQTIGSIEARESLEMPPWTSQRRRGSGGRGKCEGGIGVQSGDWGEVGGLQSECKVNK